jgi:hypothetical protein
MYCQYCGAKQEDENRFCIACGQPVSTEVNPAVNIPPQPIVQPKASSAPRSKRRFKGRLILACIPLLILAAILFYNNSGIYQFEPYGTYSVVTYHGSMEKLANDDYGMLKRFLETGEIDGTRVSEIRCNDYIIKKIRGSGGTVDIVSDTVTFYDTGLIKAGPDSEGYYDRFRNDFSYVVETHDQLTDVFILGEIFGNHTSHEYYFCNSNDVMTWIMRKT